VSVPELSVVIPAYNEALRLPRSLERIRGFLKGTSHEIVVVDDGSSDDTAGCARDASGGEGLRLLRNERNRGKGHSVRRGMLAAQGAHRLMTDADLSTPIEELPRLMAHAREGFPVVIASRALPGARIEVHQSRYRENVGRAFNLLVRALLLPGLHDTQCGFKLFSAEAARDVFEATGLDGFCFDVEALVIARRRGYRIAEVPVTWRNDAATRVGTVRGSLAFLDLARIRWNAALRRYDREGRHR
jgi:dolichyl-phosphate beta-glucosyltransferase